MAFKANGTLSPRAKEVGRIGDEGVCTYIEYTLDLLPALEFVDMANAMELADMVPSKKGKKANRGREKYAVYLINEKDEKQEVLALVSHTPAAERKDLQFLASDRHKVLKLLPKLKEDYGINIKLTLGILSLPVETNKNGEKYNNAIYLQEKAKGFQLSKLQDIKTIEGINFLRSMANAKQEYFDKFVKDLLNLYHEHRIEVDYHMNNVFFDPDHKSSKKDLGPFSFIDIQDQLSQIDYQIIFSDMEKLTEMILEPFLVGEEDLRNGDLENTMRLNSCEDEVKMLRKQVVGKVCNALVQSPAPITKEDIKAALKEYSHKTTSTINDLNACYDIEPISDDSNDIYGKNWLQDIVDNLPERKKTAETFALTRVVNPDTCSKGFMEELDEMECAHR